MNRRTSLILAAVGMQVLVYSNLWAGPRPATVVGAGAVVERGGGGDGEQYADVNVQFNGFTDDEAMAKFDQASSHGTVRVAVYDPMNDEKRREALSYAADVGSFHHRFVAEWPPPTTLVVGMVREQDKPAAAAAETEPVAAG